MRKLLKYDLKALFPIWGISTAAILIFYVIGSFALRGFVAMVTAPDTYEPTLAELLYFLGSMGTMILIGICFVAYPILNTVFILKRFYTHFYTDQGYLTFTLPVKRTQLVGAKLVSALTCMVTSFMLILLGILVMALFGSDPHAVINAAVIDAITVFFNEAWMTVGGWLPIYVAEALLLLVLLFAVEILFIYTCITLGAVWAKKNKILVAFLIYYISGMVFSPILQFFNIFAIESGFAQQLGDMETPTLCAFAAVLLLLLITIFAAVSWLLYYFNVRLLHKKLNLA